MYKTNFKEKHNLSQYKYAIYISNDNTFLNCYLFVKEKNVLVNWNLTIFV